MQEYVCGFAFNSSMTEVLLIRKNRPEWQKGFLNGVGGHIEDGETSIEAMLREFKEEAGLDTISENWTSLIILSDPFGSWRVYFYYGIFYLNMAKSMTDELLIPVDLNVLHKHKVIPNLLWLIPMAVDSDIKDF